MGIVDGADHVPPDSLVAAAGGGAIGGEEITSI